MAETIEGAAPARPVGAAAARRVAARFRQVPFGSQTKIVLALAAPTTIILYGLLVLLELGGLLGRTPDDISFGVMLLAIALVGAVLGATLAAIQVAALGLLRLVPWQGPALEIEEPRSDLAGIFE
jgi:hypothetical protein